MLFGSGVAERYHERWFREQMEVLAAAGGAYVGYRPVGAGLPGLSIAGPAARDVLASLAPDLAEEMRLFDIRRGVVGITPTLVGRISYTGDLGYEIWCEPGHLARLYDDLMAAGEPHGIGLFGLRALDSLRLDKSYGAWAFEYRPIYTADEGGLGVFVKPDKGDFIGRDAVLAEREAGVQRRLRSFTLDVALTTGPEGDGDVIGDEPIFHDGDVVGWVTSGGFAHHSQASVALGYVPTRLAEVTDGFEVELLGRRRRAVPIDGCLWDPAGKRMRS